MKGVLLLNIGTPDDTSEEAVRRYLKEFLMDPYVIDLPWPLRFALVHGIILRNRPKASAALYKKIWTPEGSPLLKITRDFASKVQDRLYPQVKVAFGMLVGNPNVESALLKLKEAGVEELLVVPLFPQFSGATTSSAFASVEKNLKKLKWTPKKVLKIEEFCTFEGFISSYVAHIKEAKKDFKPDHLLMSFHGLPASQVKKADPSKTCLKVKTCCDTYSESNRLCYRAQCFHTARSLAAKLGLSENEYTVSFQSRLGRAEWIQPYTEEVLDGLIAKGTANLLVVSPAFVADCLETLEELQIRLKNDFIKKGGFDFKMVKALNDDPLWVDSFVSLVNERFGQA